MDMPVLRRFSETKATKGMRNAAHSVIRKFVESSPRLMVLETEDLFMNGQAARFKDGQTMLYRDDDHLSVDGAILCTSRFAAAIEGILQRCDFVLTPIASETNE
jgi:Asp-tRNA(Asn)/Glu-tRNA(Gln) amidotransferase A subunit family amidase